MGCSGDNKVRSRRTCPIQRIALPSLRGFEVNAAENAKCPPLVCRPASDLASRRFKFWAKDGKAVMFMNEAQTKAQEAKDFKDRQAKRARAKVYRLAPLSHVGLSPLYTVFYYVDGHHQLQ